jgi:transposase
LTIETSQKSERVFFYDQAGTHKSIHREYGKTPIGTPFIQAIMGIRYARVSMMALRNHNHNLIAPETYTGTCNKERICDYFKQVLPTLKQDSIVIMDNASYHKSKELQSIFDEYKITLIFLPPYCPQYNPIEKKWAQVKHHLRYFMDFTLDFQANVKLILSKFTV